MNTPHPRPPRLHIALRTNLRFVFLLGVLGTLAIQAPAFTPPLSPDADLREPMALAAQAIPPRLDSAADFRPWFLLRGSNGVPVKAEHASWDLGDMTGRYLEGLLLARRMGINAPELSHAQERLQRYLFKLLGSDGLVHDPDNGNIDHSFSQGSTLYGLLALFEDSGDPVVRTALERLISAQLKRARRDGDALIDESVRLEKSCGSHLAGYQIYPVIRFYELTGYPDALALAEGLSAWAINDPVLGPTGEITLPLSWEGHIHSWLDTLAGCVRTSRHSPMLAKHRAVERARAVYEWVKRTNATSFGWFATYPTGGSSETCAISSAIRLALELAALGSTEYFDDVERFTLNQLPMAQFTSLAPYRRAPFPVNPMLLGCFDSQSMPDGHHGTRGAEDVGTVEGCCLNGGMRGLWLAWNASQTADEHGMTVHLAVSRDGPAGSVKCQPGAKNESLEITPRFPGRLRVKMAPWVDRKELRLSVDGKSSRPLLEGAYLVLPLVPGGATVNIAYPQREKRERMRTGVISYDVKWRGNRVVEIEPTAPEKTRTKNAPEMTPAKTDSSLPTPIAREFQKLQTTTRPARPADNRALVAPMLRTVADTFDLQDAARLAAHSMLARMDLESRGQPFFRVYPFAEPPRAEHEKWDDGDMSGRYVEALILSRQITGQPVDPREPLLRHYLLGLYDFADGLCYTRATEWTPRRACMFSQSSAMMGLLAWHRATGSPDARKLLDWHADGLMRLAVDRGDHVFFPKYEWDGKAWVNEPADKDAPPWYAGRLIYPLVQYWQLSQRDDVEAFLRKLIRYSKDVSTFIKPDGAVEQGEGWWGHLHGTSDMVAGIAEFGRLTKQSELVDWARRVYEWIGRNNTTAYGWVADVSGGHIHESCGIASRFRLGLALHRSGAADPFGEMDRFLRNHLLQNQFTDISFMAKLDPAEPRTAKAKFDGVDRMVRGTFQCWGSANDLIGHDDIEGCGAGGGVQALGLAWESQSEWRDTSQGQELRIHLLFNRLIPARPQAPFVSAAPTAVELWSSLPHEGRVFLRAHEPMDRIALRIPDGTPPSRVTVRRTPAKGAAAKTRRGQPEQIEISGRYLLLKQVRPGEDIELLFPLELRTTTEYAAGKPYRVTWKGSTVVALDPPGKRVPLYRDRAPLLKSRPAPARSPRYP